MKLGHKFDCYAQPSKSWVIATGKHLETARKMLNNTKVNITTAEKRLLDPIIGSELFRQEYVVLKFIVWIECLKLLSKIARTDPQLAYTCFISGC